MALVTRLLAEIQSNGVQTSEHFLPTVYDELRRLATRMMTKENPGATLQATALVHEAYIRLVDSDHQQSWTGRGHFYAAVAESMRRILIERARQKKALKNGGQFERVDLGDIASVSVESSVDLLDLDDAIAQLEREEPEKATLVKLRYFAGLSHEETAEVLGISLVTAKRQWAYARAWLYGRIIRK